MKRQDYITWDEYFIGIVLLSARRSKDPNTQVGACIVNEKNIILSTGYNGMPKGFRDDELPWDRDGNFQDTKYAYVCHAELNAILNSDGRSLAGSIIYVTLFPCNECAKAIIQARIKKVVYLEDKYPDADATQVSRKLLNMVGITLEKFQSTQFKNGLTFY